MRKNFSLHMHFKERDPNFSHFQRVVFQKSGSLFPQKDDLLVVFYTDINIQFS